MKNLALAVVFTLIAVLPSWAIPLPAEVTGTFTGTFISMTYGINTPVSGIVKFTLGSEYELSGNFHTASWRFSGSTENDALSFDGWMNNERWVGSDMRKYPETITWPWNKWSDGDFHVEETITDPQGSQWGNGGGAYHYFGEPWDLLTNENFLPTSGMLDLWYGYNGSGARGPQLALNFQFDDGTAPAPVPEPATILLLSSGLAGLAAWKRKRQ